MNGSFTGFAEMGISEISEKRRLLRIHCVCVVFLTALGLFTWMPRRSGPLDLRWDASVYYTLGTSMAQGKGYRLLNEPGEIQAVQYPPGLPALIALHQIVLGSSDPLFVTARMKYVWIALYLSIVISTYFLVYRFAGWKWALFAGASSALNFNLQLHFNQGSAELPYTALTIFFLAAYRPKPGRVRETLLTLTGVAALFTRTVGAALLAAWILDGLLRRQFLRAAGRMIVTAGSLLLWNHYIGTVESSPEYRHPAYAYQRADYLFYNVSYSRNVSYIDPYRPELGRARFPDLIKRIAGAAWVLPLRVGEALTSYDGMWFLQGRTLAKKWGVAPWPGQTLSLWFALLGTASMAGLLLLLKRREIMMPLVFAATSLAICAAPWPGQHVRYLCPSVPLLLGGLSVTLSLLSHRLAPTARFFNGRTLSAAIVIVILAHQTVALYQGYRFMFTPSFVRSTSGKRVHWRQLCYEPELAAMDEGIAWLGDHAPKEAVVAAPMPHWLYLQTGLKAVMPPLEPDPSAAMRLMDSVPVEYLLHAKAGFFSWSYVEPVIRAYPDRWRLVYSLGDDQVRIYQHVGSR